MTSDVKITKQDEVVEFPDGRMTEFIRIQFKVGDDGPFFVRVPKAGHTAADARAAVENYAAEIRNTRA